MTASKTYDLLIIGAGPAGISLAVEAEAAGVPVDNILILEKAPEHSWVIRSMYPEKKAVTANYKGIAAVCNGILCLADSSKEETISFLDQAIHDSRVRVSYGEEVYKIDSVGDKKQPLFDVYSGQTVYRSRIVVIAIGIFGRPRKPDFKIPAAISAQVHFDINSFSAEGEDILVVGGGDSAAEFAQFLVQQGNRVSLSYRRKSFSRMNQINEDSTLALYQRKQLDILWNSNITQVTAGDDELPVVHYNEENYGERRYDRVVFALGGTTPENFLKTAGIEFSENDPQLDERGESSVPGLFVTGDLVAGKKGGSIAAAFNASRETMSAICENYLHCELQPLFRKESAPLRSPAILLSPASFSIGQNVGDTWLNIHGRGRTRLRRLIGPRGAVLFFYHGSWCSVCNDYFAEMKKVQAEIESTITFIAISTDDHDQAHDLIHQHELWFPVAYNGDKFIGENLAIFFDEERNCFEPAIYVLDNDARVVHSTLSSAAGTKPHIVDVLKLIADLRSDS